MILDLLKKMNEYGCVAWQPTVPNGESLETLQEQRKKLLVLYHSGNAKWKESEITP